MVTLGIAVHGGAPLATRPTRDAWSVLGIIWFVYLLNFLADSCCRSSPDRSWTDFT